MCITRLQASKIMNRALSVRANQSRLYTTIFCFLPLVTEGMFIMWKSKRIHTAYNYTRTSNMYVVRACSALHIELEFKRLDSPHLSLTLFRDPGGNITGSPAVLDSGGNSPPRDGPGCRTRYFHVAKKICAGEIRAFIIVNRT